MKNLIVFCLIMASVLLISGCSTQTVVKYQCNDGSFADSIEMCASKVCQNTECPELDCSACPVKTETKIETKTLTNSIYVCPNGSEVSEKKSCFTDDISISSSSVRRDLTEVMGNVIYDRLIIDGVFENTLGKDIKSYSMTGILYKNGVVIATSTSEQVSAMMYLNGVDTSIKSGEKRAFSIMFDDYIDYDNHEVLIKYS